MKQLNHAEKEAELIFGEMREATKTERESIDNHLKEISVKTGFNFWEELEKINISNLDINK